MTMHKTRNGSAWAAVAVATAVVLGNGPAVVHAVKDDEYYRAGMGNPNVDLKMYWADAHNVLQDLDQFSALYVQYHGCAWSQNRQYYSGDEEGGSADENDYWYLGATPDFAANVAYSLYGVLKGDSTGSGSSPCSAGTFINSFTTSSGFGVFAAALYTAGAVSSDYSQTYSSECGGGRASRATPPGASRPSPTAPPRATPSTSPGRPTRCPT